MQYPAEILFSGSVFDVKIKTIEFPQLSMENLKQVEDMWADIERNDPGIPNSRLVCAQDVTRDYNTLTVHCGPSSRKMFMCTTQMPRLAPQYVHRSVAQHAVTITSDGNVILGIREVKTAYPNGRHVVPAGRLEVHEGTPLDGVYKEYEEELGLTQSEVKVVCIGAVSDLLLRMGSIEFVFYGTTSLTSHQVMQKAAHAKSASEHVQLEVFPWEPDFLRKNVLLPYPRRFVPAGYAGVVLALRTDFGGNAFPAWEPERGTAYSSYISSRNII